MRCIDHYMDLEVDSESCCSKMRNSELVFVDETQFVCAILKG